MKYILFFILPLGLGVIACSSAKKSHSSMITQGIKGIVTEAMGNQMPMRDQSPAVPKGILTTVLVYEPTHISQVTRVGMSPVYTAIATKLVASVDTDSTGVFSIQLPAGSYSIFIKQGARFYANLFDTNNNIAVFAVEEGKVTEAKLTVSSRASY